MHQYADVVKNLSIKETWSESSFLNQVSFSSRMTSAGTNPITLNFSSCMRIRMHACRFLNLRQMFSIYSEIGLTLTALGPLPVPSVTSNSTFSPSLRVLLPWISEL